MKTEIYYFSGAGNSLAVAKDLKILLGHTEIIPIIQAMRQETVETDADVVGIVFPCYFLDAPSLVKNFVARLRLKDGCYVFSIVTSNAKPGNSLFTIDRILKKKESRLAAGFNIDMPGIYIGLVDYSNPVGEQNHRLQNEKIKIKKIADIINNKSIAGIEGTYSLQTAIMGKIDSFIVMKVYRGDKKFWLNDSCNQCGMCAKVCPHKNIVISEEKSRWSDNCMQCLACLHWCPQRAIENGKKTPLRIRYHHPEIKLKEMMLK